MCVFKRCVQDLGGFGLDPSSLHPSRPKSPGPHPSGRSLCVWAKSGICRFRCPPFGPHPSGPTLRALPSAGPPEISPFFPLPFSLFFFPSSHHYFHSSFSLLRVFSWNFGGVIEAPGHSNVHVWALRLSCETTCPPPPPRAGTDPSKLG